MTAKTRHCDECQHFDAALLDAGEGWPCGEGHKPRFYQPTSEGDLSWGWKRRCEDFKDATHEPAARHP